MRGEGEIEGGSGDERGTAGERGWGGGMRDEEAIIMHLEILGI